MKSSYLVIDLETDGLDWQKDPIVAYSIKDKDKQKTKYIETMKDAYSISDIIRTNGEESNNYLLVGHNIKFDLLFLWKSKQLQDWFKQGGRIWDTQLVEYMLSGQQDKYPSLREIATKRYGCPERTKWIDDLLFNNKEAMQKGLKVSDLPKEKVLEDVQNDVLDTEQVYLKQLELVKARGKNFKNLVMLEHDALLATTEITANGMFVVKQKLLENKEELEKQLVEKQAELMQIVNKYWR